MSAASISLAVNGAAAVNITDGTTVQVPPNAGVTIALQSSTGIKRWILRSTTPVGNDPHSTIDGFQYEAGNGQAFSVFVTMPPSPTNFSLVSETVDGSGGNVTTAKVNIQLAVSSQFKARAVVTTLQAYGGSGTSILTETSNGAISSADGVTLALGDTVFIQAGTTNLTGALDSGPWFVTALGGASAKWILTRPDWWANGAVMPIGQVIDVGGEGTNYAGSQWKSFATVGSAVIGTNDPAFYIKQFVSSVTLVTGFSKLGPSQSFPGLKAVGTPTNITFVPTNFNGASTTVSYRTGAYASGGSATAAGYMGTSTVSITALVAAGTFNTNDVGTGLLTIQNW
jgi:hypothetical protein